MELIHNYSRSAKLTWGLKHDALKTIYKGVILPLMLYEAPVWIDAIKYEHNRQKYIRAQRLINLRMAKAYRTISSKALSTLTGTTPKIIRTEVAVKQSTLGKLEEAKHQKQMMLLNSKIGHTRLTQSELLRRRTTRTN